MHESWTNHSCHKTVMVRGKKLAYIDQGDGVPIVLLHGNPTSSYLWRNVLPFLVTGWRCIVPDLIGMGGSEKIDSAGPSSYQFVDHREYLDGFLASVVGASGVVLVGHDWGSALLFDWARRHPTQVLGMAYMEAIVRPLAWEEWPEGFRQIFQAFRSPAGEQLILEGNAFVEQILPGGVQRKLTPDEMAEYRRPFLSAGESRRPTLSWPRQLPIQGEPADVVALVAQYAEWMSANDIPKLFLNADPGGILVGAQREFCRRWKRQKEVTIKGIHYVQEDSPSEIGHAICEWLKAVPLDGFAVGSESVVV